MSKQELVKINKLNKLFLRNKKNSALFEKITLCIKRGEFVSIIGKSGAGKSTLLNIIGLLDTKFSGEYYFDDQNISEFSEYDLAKIRNKNIGFVFQNYKLLPEYTVEENVLLPNLYTKGIVDENYLEKILKAVSLFDKKDDYPGKLSGGQQQRVAIARALIHKPEIIIADEPTGALDADTGRKIMELFSSLNKAGNTILIVTHDMDIANYSEKKYVLTGGELKQL